MDWTKVTDFRQELEPGWPIVLRVGDGHWRTVMMEVEEPVPGQLMGKGTKETKKVTKPRAFPSLALVMRPMWVEGTEFDENEKLVPFREFQSIDVWSDLWK